MPADSSNRTAWRRAILLTIALYLVWTAATYLLEGRLHTLLRPDATARLTYAIVANLLIGLVGAVGVLRHLDRERVLSPRTAGFQNRWRTLASIGAGLAIGFAVYAFQPTPVWHPAVIVNGFAQVLVVSTAEVLVCWAVVGSLSYALLEQRYSARVAFTGAAIIASVLFGLYHFAHSPPFNTPGMVLRLTAVGLATSTFFFVTRNVYGTIAFHNVLALYGVTQTLAARGRLAAFEQLQPALLLTAGATLLLLAATDAFGLRGK